MKGIILAGGLGTRLHPLTKVVSKQLLPIYDKPLIYYSLSTLISMGIKEIQIITTKFFLKDFRDLLGKGERFGISISYKVQEKPEGLPQAFIISKNFINGDTSCLILGDNIFYSNTIRENLDLELVNKKGSIIFTYEISNPERYGIVEEKKGKIISINEKPKLSRSKTAITGLYIFDGSVTEKVKKLRPSKRGELEITDLIKLYLNEGNLIIKSLEKGSAWLDTGTFESINEASTFIHTLEKRQGLKIGCPEELAYKSGNITKKYFKKIISEYPSNEYVDYLKKLIK